MARDEAEIHVVILPWLAFGHMTPFLQLSIALAKLRIHVSFISTPRNIQRLPKIPSTLAPFLDLVSFPLPQLQPPAAGLLPENAEATVDVPWEKVQYLKMAYDLLQEPFKNFIAEKLPNWIILDIAPYWASDIARDFNIPTIAYSIMPAVALLFFGPPECLAGEGQRKVRPTPESLTVSPDWIDFESKVTCKHFEAISLHAGLYGKNASGVSDAERAAKIFKSARAMAIRTCPEFEADYLNTYEKVMRKPVIPVGLLPPEQSKDQKTKITQEPWNSIFKWLDQQEPKSVVYVAFGSETKFTKEEIDELAYGIELSGLPFFWVLRKPDWANDTDFHEILPTGFGSRTAGRGIVHIGWAPQWEILAHSSIGGSLYHVGLSSTVESLQYGHSLAFLPFVADQPLNARLLVEKGLGIEVERDELDGKFSRKGIETALRKVMVSEESENVRVRAREAAAFFGDRKLHDNYVRMFAEYLKNGDEQQDKGETKV
ncbi:hypothetical protein ACJIZ3_000695 [Penstemon smallii]|uniref:UDP-rhamnose:rhamnosyltransferase 1 n=1 Tax=Penstemon smallii TaxID=265156 RepID=A0ABD3RBZ5_9LAMI